MKAARILAVVLAFFPAAFGQIVFVDITEGSNIPLPLDGLIRFQLVYPNDGTAGKNVTVIASRFYSDQDQVTIDILKDCDPKSSAHDQRIDINVEKSPIASLCLRIPPLPSDGKYLGSLSFLPDGKKLETRKFSFSRPGPAALATDSPSVTVEIERPLSAVFSKFSAPLKSVGLQERSGRGPAKKITLQLDSSTPMKAPGAFDARTNLDFQWNGQAWQNPFFSSQDLDQGGTASIAIAGKDLEPGEYTIPLRFTTLGANADNAKFSLTLRVRDPIVLAIAALLIALLFSLIITKMLTGRQRRIALLRDIQDLRTALGSGLPKLPTVVWVEAVLHLADRLSSRFWLTGADVIEAHVNSVRSTVGILKQARELRASLQKRLPALIFERAAESMDRVVNELGTDCPDDATVTRIQGELANFNAWLLAESFPAAFWPVIQPALLKLQSEINAGGVPDSIQAAIGPLKTALDTALATPPSTDAGVKQSYRDYARLRILWDCRTEDKAFTQLTATPPPNLEECFKINDDLIWARLKAATDTLTLEMPPSSGTPDFESFTPLAFSIQTDNPQISGSYLFHRKIRYEWTFVLVSDPKWFLRLLGRKAKSVKLNPVTFGPSVVQYFPASGRVSASAVLKYGADPISIKNEGQAAIQDSNEFGILKAFEGVEYVSWGIAVAVALITGLSTYYFKNPTFGSYQDYLVLLLWGIGMDQGKNFLQALQSVSSQSAGAKAH